MVDQARSGAEAAQLAPGRKITSRPRKVQSNRDSSLFINIPKFAVELHGVEKGESLSVEIYRDGIWIPVEDHGHE